jgi:hypothetical protein
VRVSAAKRASVAVIDMAMDMAAPGVIVFTIGQNGHHEK